MCEARYLHVEARVVDKYYRVGCERIYVAAALADLPQYGRQMPHHLHEAEERRLAVVLCKVPLSSGLGHHVAAPEAQLGRGVGREQTAYEVGAVQIARRLAGYDIVFHRMSFCISHIAPKLSGRLARETAGAASIRMTNIRSLRHICK